MPTSCRRSAAWRGISRDGQRRGGPRQADRLEDQAGRAISPDHSHVMLCGNAGMITDATRILEQRGLRRHLRREPGQITTEKYH